MYNTTDLYKNLSHTNGRDWNVKARIVLKDSTELNITDADVMVGGLEWNYATSQQGTFTICAVVIGEIVLSLNNREDKFTQYDFTDAVIYPQVGLTTQIHWRDGKIIEWIPIGVFTTDDAETVGTTIQITALGNLSKCDKPYSDSTLTYPATLAQIALDICNRRGLTLATTTFTNSDYVVTTKPSDTSITDREILMDIAQLAGCYCRENRDGEIEFGWYDFDRFTTPLPAGKQAPAEFRTSSTYNIATDVTITGIQLIPKESDGNQYIHGAEGYVVKIESNPLAQSNYQGLVDSIGNKIVGMAFTPYTITTLSDPSIDCGDVVLVTDKKGMVHHSFVSDASFKIDSSERFSGDAESQSKNQSVRFSAADKAQESADNANQGVSEAKASIETLNGEIVLKVSKDSVIQAINISPEGIKIDASKLDIHAYVTFTDLEDSGSTVINGDNITTGRIESQNGQYWVDLETGEVFMKNGTFAGEIEWLKSDSTIGGHIFYTSAGGLRIEGPTITIDGQSVTIRNLSSSFADISELDVGDITTDGKSGLTGSFGAIDESGTKRILRFQNGIIYDVDTE